MRRTMVMLGILAMGFGVHGQAFAHGGSGLVVGSTADGSGALHVDFDFTNIVPVSFVTEIAGTSVYTADQPSFNALETDEPDEHYVLDNGTEVTIELTAVETGTTGVKVNGVVLDAVGESAVLATFDAADPDAFHRHPEWQLILNLPAGTYGEGTLAFKLTTTSGSYSSSESYTVRLSNGHVAALALDPTTYDKGAVACQKTLGSTTRSFAATKHKLLAACIDKIQVVEAREAADLDAVKADEAAHAACGDELVAAIGKARDKAVAKITSKCGVTGSADLGDAQTSAHVGYVACEVDRLIAASYPGAKIHLEHFTVGVNDLASYFPCLAGATVAESHHE